MRPDGRDERRRGVRGSDLRAWIVGLLLSAVVAFAAFALDAALRRAECSGEYRPFLGSGKQTFVIHGCLARYGGPLIGLKKRLGIYDPRWMTVIK